jgi:hypothetical protein
VITVRSAESASDPQRYQTAYPTDEREIVDEFLFQVKFLTMLTVLDEMIRCVIWLLCRLKPTATGTCYSLNE